MCVAKDTAMKTRSLSFLIGISALAVAGGCAAQSSRPAPQQAALIQATCRNIMRVGHSGVDLAACTESLSDSLAAREQGYADVQSDRACSGEGLTPGSAQFATCVLDRKRHYQAAPALMAVNGTPQLTYDPSKDVDASENYYDASFDTKRRREEYSCAQLGLDPDSGGFGQCVASLDASLFNADHPNP
jgi:hypothetical protein